MEAVNKIPLVYAGSDIGYCRVYYKAPRGTLFCLQDEGVEGSPNFLFYVCTTEEEPLGVVSENAYQFPLVGATCGIEVDADAHIRSRGLHV